jgi:hypothetical protein
MFTYDIDTMQCPSADEFAHLSDMMMMDPLVENAEAVLKLLKLVTHVDSALTLMVAADNTEDAMDIIRKFRESDKDVYINKGIFLAALDTCTAPATVELCLRDLWFSNEILDELLFAAPWWKYKIDLTRERCNRGVTAPKVILY